MGSWNGVPYEMIEVPDNPREADTKERRAALYHRIQELGHPKLLDQDEKEQFARRFDISVRQVWYDLDVIKEYVAETLDYEKHVSDVSFVFDKAMSEAVDEGEWEKAADIAMQQGEWLERRGIIENEDVDKVEIGPSEEWRNFLENGQEADEELDDPDVVDVDAERVDD